MTAPFVIFDFDGVIADTERLHLSALQSALEPKGVNLSVEEYESGYLGSTDHDLLIALAKARSISWSSGDIESIVRAKSTAFDALLSEGPVVYPSAIRCIDRLADLGATLAIASGAFRYEIESILDVAKLRHRFPIIVGAGEYSAGKPAPAPYLEAARRIGRPATAAVVIEDTPWGLTSATAAGCATIAVTHTYSRAHLTADVIIDSLDEVTSALLLCRIIQTMSKNKLLHGPPWLSMLMGLAAIAAVSAQTQQPARIGEPLGTWTQGFLEIHQISTGRGNAMFSILPDGKTLLFDAGESAGIPYADQMPNDTETPGEWIARYIKRAMGSREAAIDFAVISHFHPDHMGAIAHVGAAIPIRTLIDRGYTYVPPAAADRLFSGYLEFANAMKAKGTRVEAARVGSTSQITSASSAFKARVISANDQIWTGAGDGSTTRFAALDSIPSEDRPTENMCSVTLRLSYGAFDYFTGGDMPGYPMPGGRAWHDLETAVAKVIGPTDALVINHHGSIESANAFFLSTLKPRVMVLPAWSPTHPSPDVLKRLMATRIYPDPRDIFVVQLREPTKATIGARAGQVASDHGHIVIRVEPGGAQYWVIVLDDTLALPLVRSIHGPYAAK